MTINAFEQNMDTAIASGDPEAIKALLKSGMETLDTMISPAPEMPEILSRSITADMFK